MVRGWAYHGRLPVVRVGGAVGGSPVRAIAVDIERDDVYERHRETPHRSANARRSGYLLAGLVGPIEASTVTLEVTANLSDGQARLRAGSLAVPVRSFRAQPPTLQAPCRVAIAMATFNPPSRLFETQVGSIRAQTRATTGPASCVTTDRAPRGEP